MIGRFAADPYGLQKLIGATVGIGALFVDIFNFAMFISRDKATVWSALTSWYVISVSAVGVICLVSGFWRSTFARWVQVGVFFATAVMISITTNASGNIEGGIFLIFGLILIFEYNFGKYSLWIAGVFTAVVYPAALLIGYKNISESFINLTILTIIAVLVLILLYASVILRHEYQHRQDRALLESRVQERTAEINAGLSERSVLLQEIHHRVKNNLQVIISMLRLEKDRLAEENARIAIEASIQSVFAMSLVHETLYNSGQLDKIDLLKYARSLTDMASDVSLHEFSLEGEGPIYAGLDFAVPFGLLLSELLSDAEKRDFAPETQGKVEIRLARGRDLVLEVSDNGTAGSGRGGCAEPLGLDLVRALVQQLHGKIGLLREGGGTRWTIHFPVRTLLDPAFAANPALELGSHP